MPRALGRQPNKHLVRAARGELPIWRRPADLSSPTQSFALRCRRGVEGRDKVGLESDLSIGVGAGAIRFHATREVVRHDSCSTLTEKNNNMASKAIKRKPYTADIDRSEKRMETIIPDSVREPLLGNRTPESKSERHEPNMQPDLWDGKGQECLGWMHIISTFVAQSVRKIGHALSQFGSLLARFFSRSCAFHGLHDEQAVLLDLSPLQEERLRFLRQRLNVPFDSSSVKHQDALKELWRLAYPGRQLPPLKSDLWKEMGWQNSDPATDFSLLHKAEGKRSEWEYPFAVAGVNISYMLVQMLDLQSGKTGTKASSQFVQLLREDEMAFDNLFCMAFQMLDAQWLTRQASYMEFNEVLKSMRIQLEQELTIGSISSVQEMPSFRLLKR
uniref:ELMO domain-containing protein n=1 Tax=Oryza punctata TaxID=4537 RepID=A0A0E0MJ57_ORYPU